MEHHWGSILVGLYFLGVTGLILKPRVAVKNKWMQLFRFLFPSWRFFEDIGHVPSLEIRFGLTDKTLSIWHVYPSEFAMNFLSFLYNPKGTLSLAFRSHLAQLINEIHEVQNPEEVEGMSSYLMVYQFALQECRERKDRFFQIRLLASIPEFKGQRGRSEVVLISPVYEVPPYES
jgi:hypothetical protein